MRVVVGSKNPVKVKATKNVLEKLYGEVEVESMEVDSQVPSQPFGIDQTIQGAINRAKNAYTLDYDLSVGIESGLMETPQTITGYIDLQWCAIYDGEKVTIGVSAGFEYPPKVIEEVLKGKEVGEVMDEVTGVENLGEKTGAISYFTKGLLDRTGNTEQCVLMAIIPIINIENYIKS